MSAFENFKLTKQLGNAVDSFGFIQPTPIQSEAFSVVMSGKDIVGVSQTGTGKTLAYLLPILQKMKFSNQVSPRALVLVPTHELVHQVVETLEKLTERMNVRVLGVYGGVNIKKHQALVLEGCDIIVATPGRLYDLALSKSLQLKTIKQLVIDEVDIMLDLGFRFQLTNIFELLPEKRQNIMFSATMTEDVDDLIDSFFIKPKKISIAVSGTPLENISQECYFVENFYTKINLIKHLLVDKDTYKKVLVFIANKKLAEKLFEEVQEELGGEICIIHSNKTQNYRNRSVTSFNEGTHRIMIATDIMARGLDIDDISHVINFDTPKYAENYMHRIGRTGRAEKKGVSVLFYSEIEREQKEAIELLMDYEIPKTFFPEGIEISAITIPEERPKSKLRYKELTTVKKHDGGSSTHEKSAKNSKVNLGSAFKRKMAAKYNKPKTRGDKNVNMKKKNKK